MITATMLLQDCGPNDLTLSLPINQRTGTYLSIDYEYLLVTDNGVQRGMLGSKSQPHKAGSQVYIAGINSDFPWIKAVAGFAPATGQINSMVNWPATILTGTADVLNPSVSAFYMVQTAGIDNMTIGPAPSSGGVTISVYSTTANAHTITSTITFANGIQVLQKITFPGVPGAGVILEAANGVWTMAMGS
jgi:hypothetical protein